MEKYRVIKDGNGFYRVQKSIWVDIEYRRECRKIEHAIEHMKDLVNKRTLEENYHKIDEIIETE